MTGVSIIVPVLNDAVALNQLFADLADVGGGRMERIVVDGGSSDASCDVALQHGARVLRSATGRARQLATGVAASVGEWLWLLHADSRVDVDAWRALQDAIATQGVVWGRFDVRLDGLHPALRVIAASMNLRSRMTGICTGDQGIFVRRDVLALAGGIPDQALMEDIELSRRLRRLAAPYPVSKPLLTSARRWQRDGILPTILLMWQLRLRYFFGASPQKLARRYYGHDD